MKLTTEQVEVIKKLVSESGIEFDLLREDVIDHLCCVVEVKLDRKATFEIALQQAVHELAPDGLHEIQRETVFLLNSNKIILMKKIMYSIGALSAMSWVAGWYFSIMHWPGALELSVYGFLGFAFLFIPMLLIDYFKTKIHRGLSEKLKIILGCTSALIIGIASIFKLLHLQGTVELLFIGIGICIFGFLPFFFFSMYKKSVS
jgi:hypothetical protein